MTNAHRTDYLSACTQESALSLGKQNSYLMIIVGIKRGGGES